MDEVSINSSNLSRIEKLFEAGIVDNEKLSSILTTLEKRGNRKQKKENKKVAAGQEITKAVYCLKNVSSISYAQSQKVWQGLATPEKLLEHLSPVSQSPIFNDPAFHFKKVVLHGLAIAEMAGRFPDHNWNSFRTDKSKGVPGNYLISLENPLTNLPRASEKEAWPEKCYRLDFALTVELLLTIVQMGGEIPNLYYRTTFVRSRDQETCVGYQKGKITFVTEDQARTENKMGICLVKIESWI